MYVIKLKHIISIFLAVVILIIAVVVAGNAVFTTIEVEETVKVPILMYHIILKNSNGNKYTVSPSQFEDDLKFISDNGYTTVFMQDLIDYVYYGKELPKNPIVLTFDDGYYNNYHYIYPLLEKYNAKAVISVVGSYTDTYTQNGDINPNYAYLSWEYLKKIAESGYFEIQNHTYNLHSCGKGRNGCKKNYNESDEEYAKMLYDDLNKLQTECTENLGKAPTTFTYPFGIVSKESFDVIKELGFMASLSCEEGINEIKRDPESLYMLKRCIRTPTRSAADILCE